MSSIGSRIEKEDERKRDGDGGGERREGGRERECKKWFLEEWERILKGKLGFLEDLGV